MQFVTNHSQNGSRSNNQENPLREQLAGIQTLPPQVLYHVSEFLEDDRWLLWCPVNGLGPKRLVLQGNKGLNSLCESLSSFHKRLGVLEELTLYDPYKQLGNLRED
mmetsp:Transcript_14391/g.16350  ORF Transcript_14391/g.16350 Transcript_14391/m.16350 type:complete len:106 (-) Transcript_14391:1346-1663(-)